MINAYLVLEDRLSYEDLRTRTYDLTRKERQREVVRILKNHAARTQTNVRAFLESAQSQNMAENINIIWAINVIAFRATPSVIYDLAEGYGEIEKIFYDAQYSEEELVDDNGITKRNEETGAYVSPTFSPQPGLTLINAPQVWAQGDSGQGIIVANIDTGTDWTHPDLANNIWNNLGEDADG
ncbi:MAG: hypothetical protein GWN76_25065, partial [candidate division Zixibacteria bacterium]|nr:hypothetical protein [candidate division Zixibacteria bacterium]